MLIIRKIYNRFPRRAVEWGLSYMLISWGAVLLLTPGMFAIVPTYNGWATIASQEVWGLSAFAVGLIRLAALYVNGAHSSSPIFRTFAGFASMFIWFFVLVGILRAPWPTTGIAIYFWLMVGDGYAIYTSAGDWYQARDRGRSTYASAS